MTSGDEFQAQCTLFDGSTDWGIPVISIKKEHWHLVKVIHRSGNTNIFGDTFYSKMLTPL